jgi:uncharacterized protein (DUF2384 family)
VTDPAPFSPTEAAAADRRMLAKATVRLFELWNLTDEQAGALLRVHRYLQLILPRNPQVAAKWMQAPDERLSGRTPIEVIRSDGTAGANRIIALLERQIARDPRGVCNEMPEMQNP